MNGHILLVLLSVIFITLPVQADSKYEVSGNQATTKKSNKGLDPKKPKAIDITVKTITPKEAPPNVKFPTGGEDDEPPKNDESFDVKKSGNMAK